MTPEHLVPGLCGGLGPLHLRCCAKGGHMLMLRVCQIRIRHMCDNSLNVVLKRTFHPPPPKDTQGRNAPMLQKVCGCSARAQGSDGKAQTLQAQAGHAMFEKLDELAVGRGPQLDATWPASGQPHYPFYQTWIIDHHKLVATQRSLILRVKQGHHQRERLPLRAWESQVADP